MGYYKQSDIPGFENKTAENHKAAVLCYDNSFYNAAATRFYYCLIHLAVKNAIEKGIPENLFLLGNNHINKANVYENAKLMVKESGDYPVFKSSLKGLKILRETADYLGVHVQMSDLKRYKNEIEMLLFREGIKI